MPVHIAIPVEREWPAHLEPIGGDASPTAQEIWRASRGFDSRRKPLPPETRRRIYLARIRGPEDTAEGNRWGWKRAAVR
jgi:hypothetical protein